MTYQKDAKEPHLFLRTSNSGAQSWIFRRTFNKKALFLTSNLSPQMHKPEVARQWVKKINAALELGQPIEGLNYSSQKAEGSEITLGEAVEKYSKERTRKNRRGEVVALSDRSKEQLLGLIKPALSAEQSKVAHGNARYARAAGALFQLAQIKLKDLTAETLSKWYLDHSSKSPIRSASDTAWLKAVLTANRFPISKNVFIKGHEDYKPLNKAGNDEGRLWRSALPEFWQMLEINKAVYPEYVNYVRFILFTAKRTQEALRPVVADFNPKMRTLVIKEMKSRTPHTIYLSRQALEIIKEQTLGKRADEKIFHIKEGRTLLHQINKALGRSGEFAYRPKDLRKAATSIARVHGIPTNLIQAMLDHSQTSTMDRHYSVDPESVAEAWQKLADLVEGIAHGEIVKKI